MTINYSNYKNKNIKKYTKKNNKTYKKQSYKKQSYKKQSYKKIKLDSIKLKNLYQPYNFNNKFINNTNYKSIFTNKNISKDIVFLKKLSFDIFYSYKYKYPLLVKELLTKNTGKGKTQIIRGNIQDPWNTDDNIPLKNSLTVDDYYTYEYYGGSPGHNAPASWHKDNIEDYTETFLFSNITPQNYGLNSGYWLLLETLCKSFNNNNQLTNIHIFTGSIPNTKVSLLYNVELELSTLNIPIYMFKIVCFNHIQYPDITFIDIFIFKNKLYKIDKTKNNINFIKFLLPIKSYNWFETISNINITNLLHFYNIKTDTIKSFKNVINLNINIKNNLRLYIDTSYNMATLTEATTLDDLYNNYNINIQYINI